MIESFLSRRNVSRNHFRLNLIVSQFSYLYFRDTPREERRQVKARPSHRLLLLINLGVLCLLLCYNTTDVFSIFLNEWTSLSACQWQGRSQLLRNSCRELRFHLPCVEIRFDENSSDANCPFLFSSIFIFLRNYRVYVCICRR